MNELKKGNQRYISNEYYEYLLKIWKTYNEYKALIFCF